MEQDLMPEPSTEPPIDVVPLVRRKLAWDMFPHDEILEMLPLLGLIPSSDEGTYQEHLDSHIRTYKVGVLRDLIAVYSGLSAEILGTGLLPDSKDRPVSPEQRQHFNKQNAIIINSAVYAIFAQFFDDGLVTLDLNRG